MFRFDRNTSQQKSLYQSKETYNNSQMNPNGTLHKKPSTFLQQKAANTFQQVMANSTHRISNNKPDAKDQSKISTRSPYRPKLIQHLIDSSDSDNQSFISDQDNNSCQSDQFQPQSHQQAPKFNNPKFENKDQDSLGKSFFTNHTEQTALSKATKVSKSPTQILNKKTIQNFIPVSDSYSSTSQQLILRKEKKSNIQIKYDTLKLSQYDKQQASKENQLYLKNRRQFEQNMPTTKIKLSEQLYRSNLFQCNKQNDNMVCVDSLQEMKMNEQRKSNLERKIMSNSTISLDKSYALKSVSQILKNQLLDQEYDQNQTQNQSKIQQINLQLKRSKDVIKTLTLKNNHLQKTLQMQNVQIQQLQSQKQSQNYQLKREKQQKMVEDKVYEKLNQFMRLTVKQFMEDVKEIKMSPLLEKSLQQFMTELLQIDSYAVNKKLGVSHTNTTFNNKEQKLNQKIQKSQKLSQMFKHNFSNEENGRQSENNRISYVDQNRFKTALLENNHNSRHNAFMSTNVQSESMKQKIGEGVSVKVDLSSNKENFVSNKENITPNKKSTADQQFKLLEKSLQKLKNMEKQLHSKSPNTKLSTPVPKRQNMTLRTKYQLDADLDQEQQRSQYSLINRRQFSTINDQSQMNISSSNLDRSKSRRKKIFAQNN